MKVNLSCLIGCNALPAEDAVLSNPIPALKKKPSDFYTNIFCKVLALIVGQNPFSQRKNLSNTGDTPPLPKRRNGRELVALVTTSHMFWPNQRRNVALSLRFWLPNSILPVVNVTTQWTRGGGEFGCEDVAKGFDRKATQKILPNGSPCPVMAALKKPGRYVDANAGR